MSGPYVYRPPSPVYATQFSDTPYYVHTPRSGTPFIPDSALYPSSPYSNPGSLHPSPNRPSVSLPGGSPNRYAFPSAGYDPFYEPPWEAYQRPRRLSWNDRAPYDDPVYPHDRRHSFGSRYRPQVENVSFPSNNVFFYVNPWINAESPRGDFFFDLALPTFSPMRLTGHSQSDQLPPEEMIQPATHPPITRLRIVCDLLPDWPIELALDPFLSSGYQPPITLSDVLIAIHRSMHKQIAHQDWDRLSNSQAVAVSRAYTRRCRSSPTTFDQERAKGVMRVDFLLGKTRMVGLLKIGRSEGFEVMKLIVA